MKNAPKTIFLNIGSTKGDESEDFKDQKDVTWSGEQVNPMDIEYALVEQQPTGEVLSVDQCKHKVAKHLYDFENWQAYRDDAIYYGTFIDDKAIQAIAELYAQQYKARAEAAELRVKELERYADELRNVVEQAYLALDPSYSGKPFEAKKLFKQTLERVKP